MSYEADQKLIQSFDQDLYTEIVQVFKDFDKNGNGVIEINEFEDLIKELGFTDTSKQDIETLFKDIDLNNDSTISFAEFLVLMKKMTSTKKEKKKTKQ